MWVLLLCASACSSFGASDSRLARVHEARRGAAHRSSANVSLGRDNVEWAPYMERPRAPPSIDNRTMDRFIVVPEYKLLFCYIEKVACKSFNMLFQSLRAPYDPRMNNTNPWYLNTPFQHGLQKHDVERLIADPSWHKAVFVREPLERFLSAFRSKCAGGDEDGRAICRAAWHRLGIPPRFADVTKALGTYHQKFDHHFVEQHRFCGGLRHTLPYYDTIVQLDKDSSHEAVKKLLLQIGVNATHVDRLLDGTFPTHHTNATACVSCHATNATSLVPAFYSHRGMVKKVVAYYLADYLLFGLRVPSWAWPALGIGLLPHQGKERSLEIEALVGLLR